MIEVFLNDLNDVTMVNDQQAGVNFGSWLTRGRFVSRFCLRSLASLRFVVAWLPIGLILAGWVHVWPEQSCAQIVLGDRSDDELEDEIDRSLRDTLVQKEQSVFIPAPREVIRPLLRADRAIKEKEMTRAVSLLGEVLSDSTAEDYLVPVASAVEGVSASLRIRAQDILGSLSPKDRQLYRLRYGIQAKKMLEKALQSDDFTGVSQVMQRFFFTDAGFDAAMLLGHYHLDEGRPIAAANCFSRVTRYSEGRAIHDPEASVLLATCWMLGDSRVRAITALTELKKNNDQDSINFMGKPVRLFDNRDQTLSWLENLIGDSPLQEIAMVNQWVMSGGNPQRNARSGTGFPLISPRWSTVTLNDPDFEESVVKRQRDLIHLKSAPIPAVQPLAVGDTIVMRAFDRMIGVDFKTGKRIWAYPPTDFTAKVDSNRLLEKPRKLPKVTMTERMWQDSIYGQASSDGQRIFVVPKPGFSANAVESAGSDSDQFLQRTYNELQAIDIERQGAFVWEVGGETGLDEPKLAKTLFLGAPLPLRGELFAVCRQQSEVLLVVLDARTGKLNWQQRLGTTETSLKIENDRYRRLSGATPSFADGVVVCSTGTGALVGVDLSTRSLLWGYQYTSPGKKEVQPISPGKLSNSDPLTGLWRDSTITIADGKVLFTPVDSQELICVDLQNGFPGYDRSTGRTAKSPRLDSLLVACVENGLTILLGETNVRAISLLTGNPVWKLELDRYGKPSGRGYVNRGSYYFPTTSKHVVQVDLKTGKLVKAVQTDGVLGNLICHKGDVLSHGVDRLSTFLQDEPMRELVELAQQEAELTPEQMAIKSQLQLQDGDLKAAIETIQLAFERTRNPGYRSMLFDLILQMMESDFDYGCQLAEKHAGALIAERKLEYLTLKIGGQNRSGKFQSSIDDLFGLLDPIEEIKNLSGEFIEVPTRLHDARLASKKQDALTSEDQSTDLVDYNIALRLDRWIALQIDLIFEQSDKERRSDIARKVNALIARLDSELFPANDARKSKALYDLLEVFPLKLIDAEFRLQLFSALIADGEICQAKRLKASLESSGDSGGKKIDARASALLAERWLELGLPDKAIETASYINSNYAEIPVSGKTLGAEFAKSILDRAGVGDEQPESAAVVEFNQVEVTSSSERISKLIPCRIRLKDADSPKYATYQFRFLQQTGEFYINDANGKQIHRFVVRDGLEQKIDNYSRYTQGQISIKNDLALVNVAREVFVFDWVKLRQQLSPVLWYKSISGGSRGRSVDGIPEAWGEVEMKSRSRWYENRAFVSPIRDDVVCYFDLSNLIAVDTRTGRKIWERPSRHPGSVLLGNKEYIAGWNANKREVGFYSPADGRLIGIRNLPADVGSVWQAYGTQCLVSNISSSRNATRAKVKSQNGGSAKTLRSRRVKTLGLYDLFSQKMIWEKEYPARSGNRRSSATLACRVGHDRIAVLPPGDELEFVDVKSGRVLFKTAVKLDVADRAEVDGIGVAIKRGKYLVHLKRGYCPTRTKIEELKVEVLYIDYSELSWKGTMICVDSQTGRDLWKDHVQFDHFQIGQNTPFNTPLYVFIRRFNDNVSGSRSTQVVGVNLENGQQVFNSLIRATTGYQANYHFVNDPQSGKMLLNFDDYQAVLKMGYSDDLPPAPVARLLRFSAIPSSLVTRDRDARSLNTDLIRADQEKVLQKAVEAQQLLVEKRERERRLLEAER